MTIEVEVTILRVTSGASGGAGTRKETFSLDDEHVRVIHTTWASITALHNKALILVKGSTIYEKINKVEV